jgi:hypothetical protein
MKNKRLIVFYICILSISILQGCERLKDKWNTRERRVQYLRSSIDSARKHNTKMYDSIGTQQDTIMK